MKKILLYITLLGAIISLVVFFSKEKIANKDDSSIPKIEVGKNSFNYKNKMQVLPYKDGFIIYDGNDLAFKDDKFKDKFDVRLKSDNFVLKTSKDDFIYVLDKSNRILYKIDSSGDISSQAKFVETGIDVYPLENKQVILHYSTSVKTDGVIIYDKDLQAINNISYPNALINDIIYDSYTKKILLSAQTLDYTQILNAIYSYNDKYEVQEINQFKNLVTTAMEVTNNKIFLCDPQSVYIMDKELTATNKIEADDSFSNVRVVNDKIYLQDGPKLVKIFDKDAKLLKEMASDEPIFNIYFKDSNPILIGKNFFTYQNEKTDVSQDVLKSVFVNKKTLILFFRNSYQTIKLQ